MEQNPYGNIDSRSLSLCFVRGDYVNENRSVCVNYLLASAGGAVTGEIHNNDVVLAGGFQILP